MSWIVVILKPNQSKRAEENLANQGFETFFPRITYPYNGKSITKDLFPGYGFIKLTTSEKFVSINSTLGVSRVMHINNSIPRLTDLVIKTIKKQLKDLNSLLANQNPLRRNDQVIINLDIFHNQEAEVINVLNKKSSQKALIKILNSSLVVWVDVKDLEVSLGFGA